MSQAWAARPSDLLELTDSWERFAVDEAVHLFGTVVEGKLQEAEAAAHRTGAPDVGGAVARRLEELLGVAQARRKRRSGGPRYRYDLSDFDALRVEKVGP